MSIKIENVEIFGWRAAIRGSRNPMNSWGKSDSWFLLDSSEGTNYYSELVPKDEWYDHCSDDEEDKEELERRVNEAKNHWSDMLIGPADHKLLMNLCKGGSEESKWRRMIHVQMDITAPLYWWKEFDTYKVGTVSNSCSTMHKIQAKEFTADDFSCEHLFREPDEMPNFKPMNDADHDWRDMEMDWHDSNGAYYIEPDWNEFEDWIEARYAIGVLNETIHALNHYREKFLETKDKKYWWQMIQLLPSSYNQRRTIDLNYEVLAKQYRERKDHKLDEWRKYCEWIKSLPYSEFITMEQKPLNAKEKAELYEKAMDVIRTYQ